MDVPRKGVARKKMIRRIILGTVVLITIPLITLGLMRMKPAAPPVEWATLWPDTVKRGEMLRQVRGLGTLIPEDILAIPSTTDGRVERRLMLPGTSVKAETILMELSNPELMNQMVDADWQVKAAESNYTDLKIRLENQRLDQEAQLATVKAQYNQAKLRADRDSALFKEGLTVEMNMKISQNAAEDLLNRYEIDRKRLAANTESVMAQLAAQQTRIEQLRAIYALRKSQVEALKVRAGTEGVLQELAVQVGQRVGAGVTLAKVVQPWRLKAEVKIPETQVKDVMAGQPCAVDTRNGIINGKVSRIDPAAQNGTVTVDCVLLEELPKGARPDLSVEGTIELERLTNVMFMGKPVFGQEKSLITIFKVDADRKGASKVQVRLGKSSVSTIEVLEGLKVGDQVVLSDMSAYDAHDRISFR
ncbi:MAG: efflux RND transporter periplasmic adaptor subunit [Bryobacteraceae bacterium]